MAFLLALQGYIASPIRALDEFDVHMDPKNREAVARLLVETVRSNPGSQYLVITPWHHPIFDEEARIIMVQKVGGRSEVAVVEEKP